MAPDPPAGSGRGPTGAPGGGLDGGTSPGAGGVRRPTRDEGGGPSPGTSPGAGDGGARGPFGGRGRGLGSGASSDVGAGAPGPTGDPGGGLDGGTATGAAARGAPGPTGDRGGGMGPGTSPGAGAGGAREPTGDPGRGAGPDTSPDEPAGGAPRGALRELLWLVPRLAGLIAGLARDSRVPGRTKLALGAAALYLASPVDLVPDFVPFLGYLDDVLLVAVVLDGLLTHVDRAILAEHWPGDPASLDRAARLSGRLAGWVPRRLKARVFGPGAP